MSGLNKHVDGLCDAIDAALFSGDSLYNLKAIEEFRAYMRRWEKELVGVEQLVRSRLAEEKIRA